MIWLCIEGYRPITIGLAEVALELGLGLGFSFGSFFFSIGSFFFNNLETLVGCIYNVENKGKL